MADTLHLENGTGRAVRGQEVDVHLVVFVIGAHLAARELKFLAFCVFRAAKSRLFFVRQELEVVSLAMLLALCAALQVLHLNNFLLFKETLCFFCSLNFALELFENFNKDKIRADMLVLAEHSLNGLVKACVMEPNQVSNCQSSRAGSAHSAMDKYCTVLRVERLIDEVSRDAKQLLSHVEVNRIVHLEIQVLVPVAK